VTDYIERIAREIRRAEEIDRVMSSTPPEEQQGVWDQYIDRELEHDA